jgi:3D (Asp-Asp-Asp) domain-containing protein
VQIPSHSRSTVISCPYASGECTITPIENPWHVTQYFTYVEGTPVRKEYSKRDQLITVKICYEAHMYGGACENVTLHYRTLFGAEGAYVQGTAMLPDGRFIHLGLPIPGEWTDIELERIQHDYYTPNNLKEVKIYWGKGTEPLMAMETAAVGPAYVGSIIYIHDLRSTPNLGFFNAIDSGGQIQDGDIDIYMGIGWKEYYLNQQIYFGGSGWANLQVWLATPIQ